MLFKICLSGVVRIALPPGSVTSIEMTVSYVFGLNISTGISITLRARSYCKPTAKGASARRMQYVPRNPGLRVTFEISVWLLTLLRK